MAIEEAASAIRMNVKFGRSWRNPEKIHAVLQTDAATSLKNNRGALYLLKDIGDEEAFLMAAEMAMTNQLSDLELEDIIPDLPLYRHEVFSWLVDGIVSGKLSAVLTEKAVNVLSWHIKIVICVLDEKENIIGHVPQEPPAWLMNCIENLGDESKRHDASAKIIAWSRKLGDEIR
jgi:hypothetical protein